MAVINHTAASVGRTVTSRYFGTGDGSRVAFQLAGLDSDMAYVAPAIYKSDWAGNSLLYPTARTNMVLYSQVLGTTWTNTTTTVGDNAGVAPDGTSTAELLTSQGSGSTLYQLVTSTATSHSYSIYVKASVGAAVTVRLRNNTTATTLSEATLTFATGVLSGVTGGVSVESLGNGWFRLNCYASTGITIGNVLRVNVWAGISASTVGDAVYAWGAQVESGITATSYIPTVAATASVTDYSLHATNGQVTFASAPAINSTLAYKQPWAPSSNVFMRFGTGDGTSTVFSLPYAPRDPFVFVAGAIQGGGSGTNNILQSNAFTTTWAAAGTPAPTQNVTGPDGIANSAWTLTDDSAVATEAVTQNVTITAAPTTFSIFVKKTTGATAFPVIYAYLPATNIAVTTIDTNTGTATPWTAYTGLTIITGTTKTQDWGDYWRISMTFTGTAAAYEFGIEPAATTTSNQSTGTTSVTVQGSAVFYGAQVETAPQMSSYVQTTTVAKAGDYTVAPSGVVTFVAAPSAAASLTWTGAMGPMP